MQGMDNCKTMNLFKKIPASVPYESAIYATVEKSLSNRFIAE